MGQSEAFNGVQGGAGSAFVRADAVYLAGEHQAFIVGGVAGKKERDVFILNQDGDMIRRVSGRGDRDDVSGVSQFPVASEGPKRLRGELKWRRIEP